MAHSDLEAIDLISEPKFRTKFPIYPGEMAQIQKTEALTRTPPNYGPSSSLEFHLFHVNQEWKKKTDPVQFKGASEQGPFCL